MLLSPGGRRREQKLLFKCLLVCVCFKRHCFLKGLQVGLSTLPDRFCISVLVCLQLAKQQKDAADVQARLPDVLASLNLWLPLLGHASSL